MYLERLEIFGFKSFAEKTVLEFQEGITVIVGPNGCGKSNVFDAVRWVLGEQSVKELRGASMEDVIFNGTDKKPALGFAEVSLIFSNQAKIFPIEHDEVMVTRRLFRSGESEYLINKNVCRLKDIVEMFLGTGVGAEAYSLIQQGKVDLVVSAKPDERRQIFDEAAGITKYKAKKREALSKLKETEDNLVRLNDIIVEVKRQIASIERQAKKAQRYKEEFEQLKNLELILAGHQIAAFNKELEAVADSLKGLQTQEQQGLHELEDLTKLIDQETQLVVGIGEKINNFKEQQIRLDNDIEVNVRQVGFNEERLQNIDDTTARLEDDKKAALERCRGHQSKIETIKVQLGQITQSLTETSHRLEEKQRGLNTFVIFMEQTERSIQSAQAEIFTLNAQEVRLKNQLTENMKRVMEQNARKVRLEQEQNKVNQEKFQANERLQTISAAIDALTQEMQLAKNTLSDQQISYEHLKDQLAVCEGKIDELEKSKVFLASQKDFIARMQRQYQDNPDPVVEGRFVSPLKPAEGQTGMIGKIKSIQKVFSGYEIVYQIKYVELDLASMEARMAGLEAQLAKENSIKEQLQQQSSNIRAVVDASLKNVQTLEKKISVLESQKNDSQLESSKITAEAGLISTEFTQIKAVLADLKRQEIQLSGQWQGVADEIVHVQEAIKTKEESMAVKNQEREAWNMSMVQLKAQAHTWQTQQQGAQENLNLHTQNLERDLSDISRFDHEIQESVDKKVKINNDIANCNVAIEHLKAKKESLSGELDQCLAQKAQRSQSLSGLHHKAKAMEDQMTQSKTQLHHLQMRQQELQFNQHGLKERLLQTYKVDWEQVSNSGVNVSLDPSSMRSTPQDDIQVPVNDEQLSLEIERLKKRCESYGAVNLVAIEEFGELKQRFEFLTKQQSDLLTAREQLMSTIVKINRTTRQMFTETFTRVSEEFRVYFRMLFGGGEAQLVLLNPEDALESGIDIVARPPGKKLQNISLLSGGEKALTAIALIFGVFKVNPSPFCILDEIDAPLDESNIDRFVNLVKEFTKISQFIVITHNKKSMAAADIMYGVTMPEHGISRIVSVKLNEYHPQTPSPKVTEPLEAAVAGAVS